MANIEDNEGLENLERSLTLGLDDKYDEVKQLMDMGIRVTDFKDRKYFRSIYFRDARHTGGVLFEVATDGPGFDVDEDADALGRELRLPPGLTDEEAVRANLPDVTVPA